MKLYKFVYYFFIFIVGMLFKLVDDILDIPQIFSDEVKNYKYFFKILFISSLSYMLYYETNIIPLVFLATISGYYVDNQYNLDNINDIYWKFCSILVFIYFFLYMYFNINDFIEIYSQLQIWFYIIIMYFLSLLEMLIFKEEVSIEKLVFRIIVVISFTAVLLFNYYTENYIFPKIFNKIIIFLDGYALMSVINMSYVIYNKDVNYVL